MKKDGQLSNLASFAHDQYLHFLRAEDGLTIVEYALAAGLIVAAIAVSFGVLGGTIDAMIVTVIAAL
jgi:pilus assembly protein Flp/PilA